ncbi:hypothetical protein ARMGADRAFT_1032553 [Armillaria gallica]|uniref:Uncharacterized protein n=1 Tax=Armillaria gallica TaxID=47427 RepID=A0A2H3D5M8_ARMGA|nr:hypothetical protein ARMGADRAFT_1032553 [Armillaria gallica]
MTAVRCKGKEYQAWYNVAISSDTLWVAHGSLGPSHDYLLPLLEFCIPVIVYDGNSRLAHFPSNPFFGLQPPGTLAHPRQKGLAIGVADGQALRAFRKKHGCLVDPWPEELVYSTNHGFISGHLGYLPDMDYR